MYDVKFYREGAAAFRAVCRDKRGRSSFYLLAMAEHYDARAASLALPAGDDEPDAVKPAVNK
jgi:hypothetical protein